MCFKCCCDCKYNKTSRYRPVNSNYDIPPPPLPPPPTSVSGGGWFPKRPVYPDPVEIKK